MPKGKRFEFYAAALPQDVLEAAISGARAVRNGDLEHIYADLIYTLGVDVRYMLYGEHALGVGRSNPGTAKKWALDVGLALLLESFRRKKLVRRLPTDPFSRWQMTLVLGLAPAEVRSAIRGK